jgi:hypothetical protein
MNMDLFLRIITFLILLGVPIFALFFLYKERKKKLLSDWEASKQYVTLKIMVPRQNEKTPIAAEQMFASLHGIYKEGSRFQDKLSFEIVAKEKFIQFYVHVPDSLADFAEGQIYAQYPDVEIIKVNDYTEDGYEDLKISGCELVLNKNEVYPIKTFTSFEVDPLSAITSVLGKIDASEQIWIQFIIKPVSDNWQNKGIRLVSSVRSGQGNGVNILGSLIRGFFRIILDIIGTATGQVTAEESTVPAQQIQLSGPQEAALKEVEKKITKLGFETKIRIVSFANDSYIAKSKNDAISGVFKQFNTLHSNGFKPGAIMSDMSIVDLYKKRDFSSAGYILNIEELASLFHLPTTTVETPHIVWAGSKKGEPPTNLPLEGLVEPKELTVFATADFRNISGKFGIKKKDRRLHMYAIGKTGTGKSTMLENMIIDDIREGRGVAVVDPHGELINHVLDFIPNNRINDVIYFNPADKDYAIGFNPLESVDPDLKNIVASGVVGIFKKIFGESWGPRLEYILRNAILALLDYPDSTLLGIMKLLVDKDYRKMVVAKIKDPVIKDFFMNEYEKYDPKFRTEAIAPIQNKVGQFLSSSTVRNIVGQPKSSFDPREVMDQGKILLLDLSIGKIGEDNAALLGAMMITKIQLAAMQRADAPEEKRRDFYLYVDEFQNFATDSFAVILSEARKYHLNLIMTNQYIAQMPEIVAKAIFGNVGTLVSFRVGAQDASVLVKEFEPVFEANDMVNLGNFHIYVKMAIDGVTRPAFSAITLPPSSERSNNREKIIASSRERYTKSRSFVESKIAEEGQKKIETTKPHVGLYANENNEYNEVYDTNGGKWYIPNKDKSTVEPLITQMEANQLEKSEKDKELKPDEIVNIDST